MKHVLKMGSLVAFTWLLCVSVLVHGMQGGKDHGNDVWVRTSDNQIVPVPQWNIEQMSVLQDLLLLQQDTQGGKKRVVQNSKDNPIVTTITKNGLILLNQAFDAIAEGKFSEFYEPMKQEFDASIKDKAIGEGALRVLTNASEAVGATSLSAMLGAEFFPSEIQAIMVSQIMEPIAKYIESEFIEAKWLSGNIGEAYIFCVAFSPNGKYIASGLLDFPGNFHEHLIIWDGITGELKHKLDCQSKHASGKYYKVICVAFSNNSKYLLSGSHQWNSLFLWDVTTGEKLYRFEGKKIATCVAFDKNNKYIVAGFDSHKAQYTNLCLWNIDMSGKRIVIGDEHILSGHPGPVKCVAFNPAGTMLASGSSGDDNNLILWDLNNNNEKIILEGHRNGVDLVAFSPSGDYLISGSKHLSTKYSFFLWDSTTGKKLREFCLFFECAAFGPKDGIVVLGSHLNLYLWDNILSEEPKRLEGHKNSVRCASFSPNGNYIISGSEAREAELKEGDKNNNLILWNGTTGEKIKSLKAHESGITCVAFNHDSTKIVSGSTNLALWTLCSSADLNFIKNNLNLSQARFLYRLYLAKQNKKPVKLYTNDPDYSAYMKLKPNIRDIIQRVFPDAQQAPDLVVGLELNALLEEDAKDDSTIYKAIMKQLKSDAAGNSVVIEQLSPELIETYRDIGQKAVR